MEVTTVATDDPCKAALAQRDEHRCMLLLREDGTIPGGLWSWSVYVDGNVHRRGPGSTRRDTLKWYAALRDGEHRLVIREADPTQANRRESNTLRFVVAGQPQLVVDVAFRRGRLILTQQGRAPASEDQEITMIEGNCLCGSVRWQLDGVPDGATACNCTACRRYGALWAYDFIDHGIRVSGRTTPYVRGSALQFHFCPGCGCVTHWLGLRKEEDGRIRVAVNLRLADPDAVAGIPIDHFDGLDTFDDLPRDGRCVADYWF
jgi:hypothetical protein